jgi:protein-S-isoprenylcysteine O-methyltransferase Ste14
MQDTGIRTLLGLMIVLFFIVRAYNHRKAETEGGKIEYVEKNRSAIFIMRIVGGVILLGSLALYFVKPEWVEWARLPFSEPVRLIGLALGYASVVFVWWTELALGKNFNTTLHIRAGHTLVTNGPYRLIRHPMYTGLFLFTVGILLSSANGLVGLPGLLSLILIIVNRIEREEATMIGLFADEYRAYMKRTGRFLPPLARK